MSVWGKSSSNQWENHLCHFALPAVVCSLLFHTNAVPCGKAPPKTAVLSSSNSSCAYPSRRDCSASANAFFVTRPFLGDAEAALEGASNLGSERDFDFGLMGSGDSEGERLCSGVGLDCVRERRGVCSGVRSDTRTLPPLGVLGVRGECRMPDPTEVEGTGRRIGL